MSHTPPVDYKATLHLPQTDFPMRAQLSKREPAWLAHWESMGLNQRILAGLQGRERYTLADGPPYANGPIHMGHAVNKVLKDIIVRVQWLSGRSATYVPGWDCHGLPIELQVEKKKGKAGQKLSHADFRSACRQYASKQIEGQKAAFQRLGVQGRWDQPYQTMAPAFEADVIRSLADIMDRGHLKQGVKPVHWCLDCGSALAEAEVEYHSKTSRAIDVVFAVQDVSAFNAVTGLSLPEDARVACPIWTTTPWTLPANRAVCVNPEASYVAVRGSGDWPYLVVAEALQATLAERYQTNWDVVGHCHGKRLAGLALIHPLSTETVPLLTGDHVTLDAGTGLVHTAPAHGQDDYQVGLAHGLSLESPLRSDGLYNSDTPVAGGLHVRQADQPIIDACRERGVLLVDEPLDHSYPHCWRHQTPLIFRATPQWFVAMDDSGLRDQALEALEQVTFYPHWGRERLMKMVAERPDWCISRQRTWGTPMALIVHKRDQSLHPQATKLMRVVADRIEQVGLEAWHELELEELIGDEAQDYDKLPDTLDVWFDAGVTHRAVLAREPDLDVPADLYLEGSDQHRGWFQSSLLTAVAMTGQAPYQAVLTHGFVVDAKGYKMSKSLGNVIAPQSVIDQWGADVLRLWVAMADYQGEITLSQEIMKQVSEHYRRIRNTLRFLHANIHDYQPADDSVAWDDMVALDQWMLQRATRVQQRVMEAYDCMAFHKAMREVVAFCSEDLGGFYLDIVKDRQYTLAKRSTARRSGQTAMWHLLQALLRWLAPVCVMTAEEMHSLLKTTHHVIEDSVFMAGWHDAWPQGDDMRLSDALWQQLMALRSALQQTLEQGRQQGQWGSSLEVELDCYVSDELKSQLDRLKNELRFVTMTASARVYSKDQAPPQAREVVPGSVWVVASLSQHDKCLRCWHRVEDVGSDDAYPGLCGRCVTNVAGVGETRVYV